MPKSKKQQREIPTNFQGEDSEVEWEEERQEKK